MVGRHWLREVLREAEHEPCPWSGGQLSLPLLPDAGQRVFVPLLEHHAGGLEVTLERCGARIELRVPPMYVERVGGATAAPWFTRLGVTVRLTRPAAIRLKGLEATGLLLLPGLGAPAASAETLVLRVLRQLADVQTEQCGQIHRRALVRMAQLLQRTAQHLTRRADAAALAASRRFRRWDGGLMPWIAYEVALNDPGGRVRQLIDTCPGVLILVAGLRAAGQQQAAHQLVQQVVRGARLPQLLRACVDHAFSENDVSPGLRRLQRQRIRRAGCAVRPTDLCAPPVAGAAAEDIPADELQNAIWYRVLASPWLQRGLARLAPAQRGPLGGFVSRHWQYLWTLNSCSDERLGMTLDQLVDYLAYTGRCPGRRSDPARIWDDCRTWHYLARWDQVAGLPAAHQLDVRGLGEWRGPGIAVRPLRTVSELVQESRQMEHCVAVHAGDAVAGRRIILHAEIEGQGVTVMVRRVAAGVQLLETAGRRNRPLTEAEQGALAAWARSVSEPS